MKTIKGLDFSRRNFSKQDLSNWFLVGADFREANLREANLTRAFYDKNTLFPKGFDPVVAGMRKVEV